MDSSGGHSQEMSSDSLVNPKSVRQEERKGRPQPENALKCPRCDSTNTKFCYYNNYSLTQPRYFCKACRRYWTKGGTLRNVPVGGGCRKNRRSSPAQPKRMIDNNHQNPLFHHHSQSYVNSLQITAPSFGLQSGYDQNDLSLAFARQQQNSNNNLSLGNDSSILDALRTGFLDHGHAGSSFYDQINGGYDVMSGTASVSVPTVKQEARNYNNNNKMMWGYNGNSDHLQQHGGIIGNEADFEGSVTNGGARENWNGFVSSWHGLLNTTPLM